MDLLWRIERCLKRCSITPSHFGRAAMGDPRFVFDLRRGRQPKAATLAKAAEWLDRHERQAPR